MHLPQTRDLCQEVCEGTKRYDFQQTFTPYPIGNPYKGVRGKCLGCKTCYMHHEDGGIASEPLPLSKLLPKVKKGLKEGRIELVTDLIEPFLNVTKLAPIIIAIHRECPEARFNFITKLPTRATSMLMANSAEFRDIKYHIQVTTVRDGLPTENIVPHIVELMKYAKSVSCRVDPYVPGISTMEVFGKHLCELAGIGIKRVTTNTMKLYRGQEKILPIDMMWYSNGDMAGSCRIVDADAEFLFFTNMSIWCKRLGLDLGVCMSRLDVRKFQTAPCEGIELEEYR